jgi:hypothetical protein
LVIDTMIRTERTLTIEYRTEVVESPFLIPTHEKE